LFLSYGALLIITRAALRGILSRPIDETRLEDKG